MDTLKIKAFILIAKYKNFTRTAQEFLYTPSAVSHMADSLEEELGVKLFIRNRKGIELTDVGKELYEKFSAVLSAEEALLDAVSDIRLSHEQSVRIGAYSSIAHHILPEILQNFKKEYPNIKITLLIDDNIKNWLKDGTADVILGDELIIDGHWKPFFEDEYVAVVPENKFFGRKEVSVNELYEYPFIRVNDANLDNYFEYKRFKEVIPVKSIENNSVIYMVKEGMGVTVLPSLIMKTVPAGVKVLRITPYVSRIIGVSFDKKHHSPACRKFVDFLIGDN